MSSKLRAAVAFTVLLVAAGTAEAQNAVAISFTGDAFNVPQGTFACGNVSYPSYASNLEMRLAGGSGDGDLYVCSGHIAPSECLAKVQNNTQLCKSTLGGNNENCSGSVVAGGNYTMCIYGYTTANNITANVGHTAAGSADTAAAAASGSVTYYIDYFKDNLFLGVAYHRVGCMSSWNGSSGTVVSDQDYDFFSDGNYCVRGTDWKGGPESKGTSHTGESTSLGTNFTNAKSKLDSCGSNTNSSYGTSNYARRSTTCSYNILYNCNSDCAIRHFSNCVDGSAGSGIAIKSPCW